MEEIVKLLEIKGYRPRFIDYSKDSEDSYLEMALAIKWIRENFGWNIESHYQPENDDYLISIVKIGLIDSQEDRTQVSGFKGFKTDGEAIETALLYTLNHLI